MLITDEAFPYFALIYFVWHKSQFGRLTKLHSSASAVPLFKGGGGLPATCRLSQGRQALAAGGLFADFHPDIGLHPGHNYC
jgi:hypothetical protein